MERTSKIIRRSIYTFLKNYHYFTSTAAILAFPASVSILLSESLVPCLLPLLSVIHVRLQTLFDAAGFPPSSQFFSFLNLKLSQTISSSILSIPFTLSFLLLAKACVIHALHHHKQKPSLQPSFSSSLSLYAPLLVTHLCNSFVIISANAATFSLLFLAFNILDASGFSSPTTVLIISAAAAIVYSVILANALIVCNLSLVIAGTENCSGFLAILKACVLIRGRASTALSLALPVNLGLALVEALFQYRIVRVVNHSDRLSSSIVLEGMFIAYLYSLFILLDTIASCILFKSLKSSSPMDPERRYVYPEQKIGEEEDDTYTYSKDLQEIA
ncbi:uncharacterized protein LOC122076282 [Macadamia integrifolia]|uniref:uncharacterized protein LOC122076282 n=1 Tax=Macadamia integrifolia TaxID=60698 RepID=UPI001C4FC75D|nr:uncharacterized protein LOC122076282 [Macadamia integrifolia]